MGIAVTLLVIAGVVVLATLGVIGNTGKPRQPLSSAEAAVITLVNAAVTVIIVLAALKIGV